MKPIVKKGVLFVVILVVLVVGSLLAFVYYVPNQLGGPTKEETLIISKNETGDDIAQDLSSKGLIRSELAFKLFLKLTGRADKLQAGYYQIPNDASLHTLIDLLQEGHVKMNRLTIPEGYTIEQIADKVAKAHIATKEEFLAEAKQFVPYNYMYGPKPVTYHVEGFLFPETYEFPIHATSKDVLTRMTGLMNKKLTPERRTKIAEKGLSIYEFIVLASIVEREALFDEDRPIIAAVFLKRLQIGMPLQSCATIEYLLGTKKPILSEEDIAIPSPYNTYQHKGLPPGPISNPGVKSMDAVLNSGDTDYLYFVVDKEGHHHFSKTYEEHLQTIQSIYGAS